ncbi:MAG: right-handed parallel beta-helix repeat-containing protein [Verrucomicrobiota bacterium JB024]|nr:right-handed parallel beta-helix repeat-containing protein [Verrucomicrobiota bacterium JB024]
MIPKTLLVTYCLIATSLIAETCNPELCTEKSRDKINGSQGPYPAEISAWSEVDKAGQREAGQQLLKDIQAHLAAGDTTIMVPTGDYRYVSSEGSKEKQFTLDLSQYEGVTVDFQGSTLWFETPDTGFLFRAGGNTVRNFYVDWDPLPYVQGVVTGISEETQEFSVRIDPGYEAARETLSDGISRGRAFFFEPESRNFLGDQLGCTITLDWNRRDDAGDYLVRYFGFHGIPITEGGFSVGDRVALLVRLGPGMHVTGAQPGCIVENATFYSSPGLVYVISGGTGPTMRGCSIRLRPGTNRLLSGNADGFNFSNTSSGPVMDSCVVEGTIGDDFINVHGHLARVIWQESPTELIVTKMNWRGHFTDPVEVEFFDRTSMQSYGKRRVTGKLLYNGWTVDKQKCLADLKNRWHSGDAAGLVEGNRISVHRLTLDAPIEAREDMILACEAFSGSGAIIRNCHFSGASAFGIRMQAPYCTIENNVIESTGGIGISLFGQPGFWGEGPYVHHAKVVGNVIKNTARADMRGQQRAGIVLMENSPSSDILIENNTFINPGVSGIYAREVDGLIIRNNTFSGYGNLPAWKTLPGQRASHGAGYAIDLSDSNQVEMDGNTFDDPGPYALGTIYLESDPDESTQANDQ